MTCTAASPSGRSINTTNQAIGPSPTNSRSTLPMRSFGQSLRPAVCVRGGSWEMDPPDLRSASRLASEDEVWKEEDPNFPLSPWWFTSDPAAWCRISTLSIVSTAATRNDHKVLGNERRRCQSRYRISLDRWAWGNWSRRPRTSRSDQRSFKVTATYRWHPAASKSYPGYLPSLKSSLICHTAGSCRLPHLSITTLSKRQHRVRNHCLGRCHRCRWSDCSGTTCATKFSVQANQVACVAAFRWQRRFASMAKNINDRTVRAECFQEYRSCHRQHAGRSVGRVRAVGGRRPVRSSSTKAAIGEWTRRFH